MQIGCLKEVKVGENRVGLTPAGVYALKAEGHTIFMETQAGANSGFPDEEYTRAGATILQTPQDVAQKADMVIKVKEPIQKEWDVFREGQTVFTYLHLAAAKDVTQFLLDKQITGIAYETVVERDGSLPLLTPMSEVAGRMAVQIGAHFLERTHGGSGVLLGGVPGVPTGNVVIIGTGVVGMNAAKMAFGMNANVTMIGRNLGVLRHIDDIYHGRIHTIYSTPTNIEKAIRDADLVIGAVYVTASRAPTLVTRDMVKQMKKGSVIADVAIDQGGIIETMRPTTHEQPVYEEEGVLHYGVTNMPGAVPQTSTQALTNATLPYALHIARKGVPAIFTSSAPLRAGLNTYQGKLVNKEVADSLKMPYEETSF